MEITLPVPEAISRLQRRLLSEFASTVEEWSWFVSTLAQWEDDHLLDNPTPELLADHETTVRRLLAFGRMLAAAAETPNFSDRQTAESVAATLLVLEHKLRMWHGPQIDREESRRILAEVYSA